MLWVIIGLLALVILQLIVVVMLVSKLSETVNVITNHLAREEAKKHI